MAPALAATASNRPVPSRPATPATASANRTTQTNPDSTAASNEWPKGATRSPVTTWVRGGYSPSIAQGTASRDERPAAASCSTRSTSSRTV